MITFIEKKRPSLTYRILSGFVAFTFCFSMVMPSTPSYAQVTPQTLLSLPLPGAMITVSPGYDPAIIKGITPDPVNPLQFNFIVDVGDDSLEGKALITESSKLIKYFMAALTVPGDEMWVNLSPYEKNRIIPNKLGNTEMGRDMLAQDYVLKQLTASLMYPEDELGNKFWDRVYKKAQAKFGTTDIPLNTFNKIWIVPEKAVVFEHDGSAYVVESHLKVMLEEDFIALQENMGIKERGLDLLVDKEAEVISGVSSDVVREVLVPEIEVEVNNGKNFAGLRQIYNSVILATWYKKNLKESLLGQIYVDKNKTTGIDVEDKKIKEKIYNRYVEAFKTGVYNYIKEDYDPNSREMISRKYFSGGTDINPDKAMIVEDDPRKLSRVQVASLGTQTRVVDIQAGFAEVGSGAGERAIEDAEAEVVAANLAKAVAAIADAREQAAEIELRDVAMLTDQGVNRLARNQTEAKLNQDVLQGDQLATVAYLVQEWFGANPSLQVWAQNQLRIMVGDSAFAAITTSQVSESLSELQLKISEQGYLTLGVDVVADDSAGTDKKIATIIALVADAQKNTNAEIRQEATEVLAAINIPLIPRVAPTTPDDQLSRIERGEVKPAGVAIEKEPDRFRGDIYWKMGVMRSIVDSIDQMVADPQILTFSEALPTKNTDNKRLREYKEEPGRMSLGDEKDGILVWTGEIPLTSNDKNREELDTLIVYLDELIATTLPGYEIVVNYKTDETRDSESFNSVTQVGIARKGGIRGRLAKLSKEGRGQKYRQWFAKHGALKTKVARWLGEKRASVNNDALTLQKGANPGWTLYNVDALVQAAANAHTFSNEGMEALSNFVYAKISIEEAIAKLNPTNGEFYDDEKRVAICIATKLAGFNRLNPFGLRALESFLARDVKPWQRNAEQFREETLDILAVFGFEAVDYTGKFNYADTEDAASKAKILLNQGRFNKERKSAAGILEDAVLIRADAQAKRMQRREIDLQREAMTSVVNILSSNARQEFQTTLTRLEDGRFLSGRRPSPSQPFLKRHKQGLPVWQGLARVTPGRTDTDDPVFDATFNLLQQMIKDANLDFDVVVNFETNDRSKEGYYVATSLGIRHKPLKSWRSLAPAAMATRFSRVLYPRIVKWYLDKQNELNKKLTEDLEGPEVYQQDEIPRIVAFMKRAHNLSSNQGEPVLGQFLKGDLNAQETIAQLFPESVSQITVSGNKDYEARGVLLIGAKLALRHQLGTYGESVVEKYLTRKMSKEEAIIRLSAAGLREGTERDRKAASSAEALAQAQRAVAEGNIEMTDKEAEKILEEARLMRVSMGLNRFLLEERTDAIRNALVRLDGPLHNLKDTKFQTTLGGDRQVMFKQPGFSVWTGEILALPGQEEETQNPEFNAIVRLLRDLVRESGEDVQIVANYKSDNLEDGDESFNTITELGIRVPRMRSERVSQNKFHEWYVQKQSQVYETLRQELRGEVFPERQELIGPVVEFLTREYTVKDAGALEAYARGQAGIDESIPAVFGEESSINDAQKANILAAFKLAVRHRLGSFGEAVVENFLKGDLREAISPEAARAEAERFKRQRVRGKIPDAQASREADELAQRLQKKETAEEARQDAIKRLMVYGTSGSVGRKYADQFTSFLDARDQVESGEYKYSYQQASRILEEAVLMRSDSTISQRKDKMEEIDVRRDAMDIINALVNKKTEELDPLVKKFETALGERRNPYFTDRKGLLVWEGEVYVTPGRKDTEDKAFDELRRLLEKMIEESGLDLELVINYKTDQRSDNIEEDEEYYVITQLGLSPKSLSSKITKQSPLYSKTSPARKKVQTQRFKKKITDWFEGQRRELRSELAGIFNAKAPDHVMTRISNVADMVQEAYSLSDEVRRVIEQFLAGEISLDDAYARTKSIATGGFIDFKSRQNALVAAKIALWHDLSAPGFAVLEEALSSQGDIDQVKERGQIKLMAFGRDQGRTRREVKQAGSLEIARANNAESNNTVLAKHAARIIEDGRVYKDVAMLNDSEEVDETRWTDWGATAPAGADKAMMTDVERHVDQVTGTEGPAIVAGMREMVGVEPVTRTQLDAVRRGNKFGQIGFDPENRLGWTLDTVSNITMHREWLQSVVDDANEIRQNSDDVIFAGMGGSGLSVQALTSTFGNDGPTKIHSLRSTSPDTINKMLQGIAARKGVSVEEALKRTTIVAISKSWTTEETRRHRQYFEELYDEKGIDKTGKFFFLSDPGSSAEGEAQQNGYKYRNIQLNDRTDVGGRFTAPTTRVFLLPLAIINPNTSYLMKVLGNARRMNNKPIDQDTFIKLGIWLQHLAANYNKDNVTFIVPKEFRDLPRWAEQLFEESLGKAKDKGVTIFYDEDLTEEDMYSSDLSDRVFVRINMGGKKTRSDFVDGYLKERDHPVFDINVDNVSEIGGLMLGLQRTVATIAYQWDINFTNQPGVEGYKKRTREVGEAFEASGKSEVTMPEDWEYSTFGGNKMKVYYTPYINAGLTTKQELEDEVRRLGYRSLSGSGAGVAVYSALHKIALRQAKVAPEKGTFTRAELVLFGQMTDGFERTLQDARKHLYTRGARMAAKVNEAPDILHSYMQNTAQGPQKMFSTHILARKAVQPGVKSFEEHLLHQQFIGTVQSLMEKDEDGYGRKIVPITIDDTVEGSETLVNEFFAQARSLLLQDYAMFTSVDNWNIQKKSRQENIHGAGRLTLHGAKRKLGQRGYGRIFDIAGKNARRDITLNTRVLSESEKRKLSEIKAKGISVDNVRIIERDKTSALNEIYGTVVDGVVFIREDLLAKGTPNQIRSALLQIKAGKSKIRGRAFFLVRKQRAEDRLLGINQVAQRAYADEKLAEADNRIADIKSAFTQKFGELRAEEVTLMLSNERIPLKPVLHRDADGVQRIYRQEKLNTMIVAEQTPGTKGTVIGGPITPGALSDHRTFLIPDQDMGDAEIMSRVKDALMDAGVSVRNIDALRQLKHEEDIAVNEDTITVKRMPGIGVQVDFYLWYRMEDNFNEVKHEVANLRDWGFPHIGATSQQRRSYVPIKKPARRIKAGINGAGGRVGLEAAAQMMRYYADQIELVAMHGASAARIAKALSNDQVHDEMLGRNGEAIAGRLEEDVVTADGVVVAGTEYIDFKVAGREHRVYVYDKDMGKDAEGNTVYRERRDIPWRVHGVDVAVDAVEKATRDALEDHRRAGAKFALLTAPSKAGSDGEKAEPIVFGVNEDSMTLTKIAKDDASCTTNNIGPVIYALLKTDGETPWTIEGGYIQTNHAVTKSNEWLDGKKPGLADNFINQSTGAAKAVGPIMPEVDGKLGAHAMRMPTADGSTTALTATIRVPKGEKLTAEKVNERLRIAAQRQGYGVIKVVEGLTSHRQILGVSESASILPEETRVQVIDEAEGLYMVKTLGWYDNEWSYTSRVVDTVAKLAEQMDEHPEIIADRLKEEIQTGNKANAIADFERQFPVGRGKPILAGIESAMEALKDKDLKGQRVVLLSNLNVPMKDGEITSDTDLTRVKNAEKVIQFLISRGADVVLVGHHGRDEKRRSVKPLADYYRKKFKFPVKFYGLSVTADTGLNLTADKLDVDANKPKLHVVENVRFAPKYEQGKVGRKAREVFGKGLAELSTGIVVVEAFADMGSKGARVEDVVRLVAAMPNDGQVYTAPNMEGEFADLDVLLEKPIDVLINGGSKEDKIKRLPGIIKHSLASNGKVLLGSYPTKMANEGDEVLTKLLSENSEIVKKAKGFSDSTQKDIDAQTAEEYAQIINGLKSGQRIVVNGTMGVIEEKKYTAGSQKVMKAIASATKRGVDVLIIGGDAGDYAKRYGWLGKFGLKEGKHVKFLTGGGVVLKSLAGERLVGVTALREATAVVRRRQGLVAPSSYEQWEQEARTAGYSDLYSYLQTVTDRSIPRAVVRQAKANAGVRTTTPAVPATAGIAAGPAEVTGIVNQIKSGQKVTMRTIRQLSDALDRAGASALRDEIDDLDPSEIAAIIRSGEFERRLIGVAPDVTAPRKPTRFDSQFRTVRAPQLVQDSVEGKKHGMRVRNMEVLTLQGNTAPADLFGDAQTKAQVEFALATSVAQALGSRDYAGTGKYGKEVADGNAVHMARENIRNFVRNNKTHAVVIRADEGARDASFSLQLNRIFFSGYEKGYMDFENHKALSKELKRLRKLKVDGQTLNIHYYAGDALEKTNGLAIEEALTQPTDSWSLASLANDTGERLSVYDDWRIAGVSFNNKTDAGVTPLDLPSVAIRKIAKSRGIKEGTEEYTKMVNSLRIFILGKRGKDLAKEAVQSSDTRHHPQIKDAQELKRQFPGLDLVMPGDGDFAARAIASLGINLDDRETIVVGRGGATELTMLKLLTALAPNGQFTRRWVSTSGTSKELNAANADKWDELELGWYRKLGYKIGGKLGIKSALKKVEKAKDFKGSGVVAMTAVTGASEEIFGETLASLLERVTYNEADGTATTNTLITTPKGTFVVRTTLEADDILASRRSIASASAPAKEYLQKSPIKALEQRDMSLKSVQPQVEAASLNELASRVKQEVEMFEVPDAKFDVNPLVSKEILTKDGGLIEYLARTSSISRDKNVQMAAYWVLMKLMKNFNVHLASMHEHYMNKGKTWDGRTAAAYNLRTGPVFLQARQIFRSMMEDDVGLVVFEEADSELRYTGHDRFQYTAQIVAAAMKQGYEGGINLRLDHLQVKKTEYLKDSVAAVKKAKRKMYDSVLAGKYNPDIDPSTMVGADEFMEINKIQHGASTEWIKKRMKEDKAFKKMVDDEGGVQDKFENYGKESAKIRDIRRSLNNHLQQGKLFGDHYYNAVLEQSKQINEGLSQKGYSAVAEEDFMERGLLAQKDVEFLKKFQMDQGVFDNIKQLTDKMHTETAKITIELMDYARQLEKDFGLDKENITLSLGVEVMHVDSKEHAAFPSTVLAASTLMGKVYSHARNRGYEPPSHLSVQSGTMHGVGGLPYFGLYVAHRAALKANQQSGNESRNGFPLVPAVFVQHGTSTIDADLFPLMPFFGTGDAHLATEYQRMALDAIAKKVPSVRDKMRKYMEAMIYPNRPIADPEMEQVLKSDEALWKNRENGTYEKKFQKKWETAFEELGKIGWSEGQIAAGIASDFLTDNAEDLPAGVKGSLKDLNKELSALIIRDVWDLDLQVQNEISEIVYKEFKRIHQVLNLHGSRAEVDATRAPETFTMPSGIAQIPQGFVQSYRDAAMLSTTVVSRTATDQYGGINLNPELLDMQIKRDGRGIPLPIPQQPINDIKIEGFLPIIINVTPIENLPLILGIADTDEPFDAAKGDGSSRDLSYVDATPVNRIARYNLEQPEEHEELVKINLN